MKRAGFDAGRLRHRVTIEVPTPAPDGAGGETLAWTALASLWARIDLAAGTERIVAGHLAGVVTHTVTIRFRDDIAGGMRVAYRGRAWRVLVAHDPDATRRYLTLKTELETP